MSGVTRLWTLGTLVPGWPSLFKDFLTTYWQTSYSLERSSSFKILLAFWGCNCWDTVVPVGLGISFSSFFYHDQTENSDWPPPYQTDLCFLSPALHMRDATHSLISRCTLPWGSRCLASWENLAFRSHHWLGPHSPSTLHRVTSVVPRFAQKARIWHSSFTLLCFSVCVWCCWVGRNIHRWPLRRLQQRGLESTCFIFLF